MPPQSRAQRRRQAARLQQQQSRRPAPPQNLDAADQAPAMDADDTAVTGTTIALGPSAPVVGEARRIESRPAARTNRRVLGRPAPEPIDYSKEYAAVRRDLRWIVLWTALLFAAMIALKLSGLV
ncbi:MAG TPA: hypothetical protein VFO07_04500 [Roseiflexaceae bacterium]|nr:hypothetical protein [Roseiflexaceae bacterium]